METISLMGFYFYDSEREIFLFDECAKFLFKFSLVVTKGDDIRFPFHYSAPTTKRCVSGNRMVHQSAFFQHFYPLCKRMNGRASFYLRNHTVLRHRRDKAISQFARFPK